jgi:hypothetical protein
VRRVAAIAAGILAAACAGGSGTSRQRARHTTCGEAIDRVEQLAGDLDRGTLAGPISGFEGLNSRRRWREACAHFSPWVRRCIVLSTVRQEISSCTPGNEPWSRRHEFGHVPPEEKRAFESCVEAANDRRALLRCGYDETNETVETPD